MNDAVRTPRRRRLSLRARVALTFAGLGLVVSACVSGVAMHFSDAYVHRLVDEMLRVEGEHLRDRFAHDGRIPSPPLRHFDVYSNAPGGPAPPGEMTVLAPGLHEIAGAQGEVHVAVYTTGQNRLYVVLDVAEESTRERHLARDLIALVLLGTGLSAWLGWAWAGRAIAPVRRLAQRVETLEPPRRGATPLAPEFAADEVGTLALAFDRYQEKLHDYVRRERAFTADASHELRTPLAVIRGAIEVMLDGNVGATDEARLRRMQRGSDELRDLLDALLVLARSDEDQSFSGRTPDLDALIAGLLGERADMLHEKHLQVRHTGVSGIAVPAPPRVLGVVIGNLLRAATEFADGGDLAVDVAPARVRIALRQPGTHAQTPVPRGRSGDERADRVLGLGMIRRVCERWGWKLDEGGDAGRDRRFVLHIAGSGEAGKI
ncbi:MAG: HAMP domain-containing protein [Xanthomonadaceae bacterium]|nr:HAMP domain-containing protein [Xanthomonadaceae bacterium]MDE2256917.1 HAMP domain-containing protein [Xanthomonadaceae bacterium]